MSCKVGTSIKSRAVQARGGEERGKGGRGGRRGSQGVGGLAVRAGVTPPLDAADIVPRTHENGFTSFKMRRKKMNFRLEETVLICNIKMCFIRSTQSQDIISDTF